MIKTNKNSSKSKAISSYILSGMNIKRMLQDQMNSDCNISDINIIRVNKRPIFKIKERQKENTNLMCGLPNKSFKIRSYTKKTKDGDKDETEIFQKLDKFRNGRANSNRIDIFNMSKETKIQKDQNQYKIESKIKQILQREASIKCKISNQVFVKQVCQKSLNNICINYQEFNSEKYRQIAHKINVCFNPKCQITSKILLIVSVQALHVHSKRIFRSSNQSYEQYHNSATKHTWMSEEQVEVLKMFSSKYYNNWQYAKVAFKVNTAQQLNELKVILEANHINDYYCIFYPIKKYVESFNLYQIDGLIQHISSVILLQSKFKVKSQFPIINCSIKTLFVVTNNDNLVVLSRTVSAIKCFIVQTIKQGIDKDDLLMIVDDIGELQNASAIVQQRRQEKKHFISTSLVVNAQFSLKQEAIEINLSQLQAKLQFTLNSRQLKAYCNNNRNHNQSTCTEKQIKNKRRTLCQRENNYPLTACKNRNILNTNQKWNIQLNRQDHLQRIKEKLLVYMKSQNVTDFGKDTKNVRKFEANDKTDEIQQISNYVRGGCKSKTNHQIISQLVKKNSHIHKQIQQYLLKIANLNTNFAESNIQTSVFNARQYTDESVEQQEKQLFHIKAYKIL